MREIKDYIKQCSIPQIYTCSSQYNALLAFLFIVLYGNSDLSYIIMFSPEKRVLSTFYEISKKMRKLGIKNAVINKRSKIYRALGLSDIDNIRIKKKIFREMNLLGNDYYLINFAWNPRIVLYPASIYFKYCYRALFIEEGATQFVTPSQSSLVLSLKKLYGNQLDFWDDNRIDQVFVQFPQKYYKIPVSMQTFSFGEIISGLTNQQISAVVDVFGMGTQMIELKKQLENIKGIIFTQPISEDGYVSEDQKKRIYTDIVDYYSKYGSLVVKKHPRDTTQYSFCNARVIKSDFPSELLNIIGKQFSFAVALCSSAVENVNAIQRINLNEKYLSELDYEFQEVKGNLLTRE